MDLSEEFIKRLAQQLQQCRQASAHLRESHERYALALRGAGDGLWDWDLRSNRVHFSAAWKSLVGGTEAAVGDHPREWFARVHPEDLGALQADVEAHLQGRTEALKNEHRILGQDGTYRWMLARGAALFDDEASAFRLAGTLTDVTARKRAEELLRRQAEHDVLTGLPNRAAFLERLERSLGRARRAKGYGFAVFFLDLDRFKLVNDSLGHLSGDELLVCVARRLVACLRPGDMVAHVGGDEFGLLVDHITGPVEASHVATRVQSGLAEPFDLGGQEVYVTASQGIALSAGYERPEDMLRDADTAMYRAKAQGYGRSELFDREMQAQSLTRLQLETDLRRAVEREEFIVHYQPIVSLQSGSVAGFEALLRWQHPERGLLQPGSFLPVAEETGLMVPIGSWVLGQACAQARAWQARFGNGRTLTMSMNLAGSHFTQADVRGTVERALQESGLEGRHLMLEITESVLMKDLPSVAAVLRDLKRLEVEFHIDDFGTGYSSLSYLHSLPTDALKIDRSFVSGLGLEGNGVVVRTIVELAHNLGRRVIAEGVETAAQLQRLRALGCEHAQGYYFARPLGKEDAESLVSSRPRW